MGRKISDERVGEEVNPLSHLKGAIQKPKTSRQYKALVTRPSEAAFLLVVLSDLMNSGGND